MRVAILHFEDISRPLKGEGTYFSNIARSLIERGHESRVVSLFGTPQKISLWRDRTRSAIYSAFVLTEAGKLVLDGKKQIPLQIIKKEKHNFLNESDLSTLKSFQEGKSISEIAKTRNLALTTIYHHIYKLIINKKLLSSDVLDPEVVRKVSEAAKNTKNPTVSKLKEVLPELSYDEIRCALAGRDI